MKKICQWLCPKAKKNQGPYDVHQQTFQMDQNFGQIQQAQKNPSTGEVNQKDIKQQSHEALGSNNQMKNRKIEEDEKKFVQSKNKIDQQSSTLKNQPSSQLLNEQIQQQKIIIHTSIKSQQQKVEQVKQQPKLKMNILGSKTKKKKFDPQDFYFRQEQNQFKVKTLEHLKGQQFDIDKCKNGNYFIFQTTGTVYIDDCQDCFVYVAPCQSSVFVRSCKNMIVVASVGQFRTYNCHNCHYSIYCRSQPVIQSSSQIHFSPLSCPQYPKLFDQFQQTKLYIWNNNWSQIHNFTKKQGQVDYYLDRQPKYTKQIDWQRAFKQANLQMTKQKQEVIPFTQGQYPLEQQVSQVLVVFSKQASQKDQQILRWVNKNNIHLLNSSKSKVGGSKNFTVALLINNKDNVDLDLSYFEDSIVYTDKGQIDVHLPKYFVSFKDQR